MFFDNEGRCLSSLSDKPSYEKSRYYFNLDEQLKKNINLEKIYSNFENNFNISNVLKFSQFEEEIIKIKNKIKNNTKTKNLLNNFSFPFYIPKLANKDLGSNLENFFFPKLEKSYKLMFPEFQFINHCKESIEKKIKFIENSNYEKFLNKLDSNEGIVGLIFPCLNEFSFPATQDIINKLPENFNLSGGYEITSALIGQPNILMRKEKYPPLLWFSSLINNVDSNIGYHIEPYGYNLTFNQRAHLDQAAEYWWHSISVTL